MSLLEAVHWYHAAGLVIGSVVLCALVIRFGIVDAPDGGRKTQARPVPNAGGIAILVSLVGFVGVASTQGVLSDYWMENGVGAVLLLVVLAGMIGLFDDIWTMSAGRKFLLLFAVAALASYYGPQLSGFDVPGDAEGRIALPVLLSAAGVALWLFVVMNAANFMDGSNGLSLGSMAVVLVGEILLLAGPGADLFDAQADMALVCLAAVFAIVGFLAWNLIGRLFAGDCGALSMGALVAGAGVVIAESHSVWIPPMLVLPFLIDVLLTLTWRAGQGEPLMQAHRDHAYQLFLRAGWGHLPVALMWWGMTALCVVAAYLTPADAAAQVFAGLLGIGAALWFWQRLTLGRRLQGRSAAAQ